MSTELRHFVVDRVEGDTVVIEGDDGAVYEVDRSRVPDPVKEGAVLRIRLASDGSLDDTQIQLDEHERARRLERAGELLDELRKRDPGGDVVL